MDPATAFSIACGVVQLSELAIEAANVCREIYDSSLKLSLRHQTQLESTNELYSLTQQLRIRIQISAYLQPLTVEDQKLLKAADECSEVAQELQVALDEIKARKAHSKLSALNAALKSWKRREKIQALETKIKESRQMVNTAMLIRLRLIYIHNKSTLSPRSRDLSIST